MPSLETVVRAPRERWLEALDPRERRGVDPADALARRGDVAKVRRGGQAHDVVVRGLQRDDLAVSVDGARLFGACPNRMDPPMSHVDAGELELLELRRGPFDVTVPGALGGSLSMRTRLPPQGWSGDVAMSYGSFESTRADGTLSYGGTTVGGTLGGMFRQSLPYLSGDGRRFTELYPTTSMNRYRANGEGLLANRSGAAWGKVGWSPAAGHRAELSLGRQVIRDALYPYLLMDASTDDADRGALAYRFERWGAFREGSAHVSFSQVSHDMDDARRCSATATPGTCAGALPERFGMRTLASTRLLAFGTKAIAGSGETTLAGDTLIGLDVDQRRWDATTTRAMRGSTLSYASQASVPDVRTLRAGAFAENRRQLGSRLRLLGGVRLDFARTSAGVDRTPLYRNFFPTEELARVRTDWLPAGNVRLELEVSPPLTLLLGVGHAERPPDPQERYFALSAMGGKAGTVGRPALKPGGNTELDAGLRWSRGGLRFGGQLFLSRLGDFIVPTGARGVDGTDAKTFKNVAARLWGGELSANVPLPLALSLRAAVTYTRGDELGRAAPLPEIPPLHAAGALRFQKSVFFADLEEAWSHRQDRVAAALQEAPTDAWLVTHFRLGLDWQGLRAALAVENLFDRHYVDHLSYLRNPYASGLRVPEPGRTVLASVSYTL